MYVVIGFFCVEVTEFPKFQLIEFPPTEKSVNLTVNGAQPVVPLVIKNDLTVLGCPGGKDGGKAANATGADQSGFAEPDRHGGAGARLRPGAADL